jgi:hypothetical protein
VTPPEAAACPTLLKLQSLLCSPYCDPACRETVSRYLEEQPPLQPATCLPLALLACPPGREGAALLCREGRASVLGPYCRAVGRTQVWAEALEELLDQPDTEGRGEALDLLLAGMVAALPPDALGPLLPPGEEFQPYLVQSRKLQQADRLQEMIVQTGRKLLDTLNL